jgi:hypothetical protein
MKNKGMSAGTLGTRGQGVGAAGKSAYARRSEEVQMKPGTLGTLGQGMRAGTKTTKTSMKKGGKVKGGSSYRKAADGVAHKGKTKAKMTKMRMGGMCK